MLRVTTLYASSAVASAAYYTRYLADAPGEEPGRWLGRQADELGLDGVVEADALQRLLEGRDPTTGTSLGNPLIDRRSSAGAVIRAVAGFDATFSAPKSVSVWWALTGDPGLLAAHDLAVAAALAHLERYGATTRIRVQGRRLHPDTVGLTMATFRQSTSRADDPQLHTHAVVSAKVQTIDGRWLALDARYLKRNQRMLGGLYQSVLRAELTHRYGIAWEPVVNGQAEIGGAPAELLTKFSKRTGQVEEALASKVDEFCHREGRDPTRWERAALTREAAVDTRRHKTGHAVSDLRTDWRAEAADVDWTPQQLTAALIPAGRAAEPAASAAVGVAQVLDRLSVMGSTWTRAEVLRAVCDLTPPVSSISGQRWAAALERAVDQVLEQCVNLDPRDPQTSRRDSDGRSVWMEPTAPHFTSPTILAEEERILAWAMDVQANDPTPSPTVQREGLDVLQADAAAAVSGRDRLVLVVGPAGTGKTTTLRCAADDLDTQGRPAFGVAPTAKAAHVLHRETGMDADTVAKLLYEHTRHDRPPAARYQLPADTTLVVDEAGMLGTTSLHQLIDLAGQHRWRLALVGDPSQLQAVGRGGLFNELCLNGRNHELAHIHRFTHPWEAAASLQLRAGHPAALDFYQSHGRIHPGTFEDHLHHIARAWLDRSADGQTVAVIASTNAHVDALNAAIQKERIDYGQLDPDDAVAIGGGEWAHPGDVVVTRRNDRSLVTSTGETIRNRERWTVTATHLDGTLTVTRREGHGTVILPADYVAEHVRLGYSATEHGHQGDTVDVGIALASTATTHRGLYVAMTRGRDDNQIHVVTEQDDPAEARHVLEGVLAHDRVDVPAVTQRRHLAQVPGPASRPEPGLVIRVPDWVGPWREQLEQRRQGLTTGLTERHQGRLEAARELNEMKPELQVARDAWQPYAQPIASLEAELRENLRPAARQSHSEHRSAGVGHRRTTQRRARLADAAVAAAEAEIDAIRTDGAPINEHLDTLEAHAQALRDCTDPASGLAMLDQLDRDEAEQLGQILDSLDTFTDWTDGRRVPTNQLATAIDTLHEVARHASFFARHPGDIERTQWYELLDPGTTWLEQHTIELEARRPEHLERPGPELSLGR